jgi:hypothetical protein
MLRPRQWGRQQHARCTRLLASCVDLAKAGAVRRSVSWRWPLPVTICGAGEVPLAALIRRCHRPNPGTSAFSQALDWWGEWLIMWRVLLLDIWSNSVRSDWPRNTLCNDRRRGEGFSRPSVSSPRWRLRLGGILHLSSRPSVLFSTFIGLPAAHHTRLAARASAALPLSLHQRRQNL